MRSLQREDSRNFFHVVLRAIRREPLFSTPEDRRALNQISTSTLRRFDAKLHAYCLLPNQFRVLVEIRERWLGRALRRIARRYSQHRFHDSLAVKHIFERPYRAQRIQSEQEFLTLLRSIHLSPVNSNRAIAPADYRWSSHRAYLGFKSVAWITTDFGLALLADDPAEARTAYRKFIAEEATTEVQESLTATDALSSTDAAVADTPGFASSDVEYAKPHGHSEPHGRVASQIYLSIY